MKKMRQQGFQKALGMLGLIGSIALISLISILAGIGTIILIAIFTPKPIIFLTIGAAMFILFYFFGARIIIKRMGEQVTQTALRIVGPLIFLGLAFGFMLPLQDQRAELEPAAHVQFWDLESDSRIAYTYLPAKSNAKPYPIIFLHGGPGVPDMNGDRAYFGELTNDGYDVYVYDQVGSGRSSRLEDPRQYSVERDVADLEFIRRIIGAEKVILIGHSYGGEIVGNYLASYEDHVEKAVFTSPGSLDPSDQSGGNLTNDLTGREKLSLFSKLLQPRVLLAYTLLQVNPLAAHTFVGDDEMDARFDRVYAETQRALHCQGIEQGPHLSGLGFYANQMPQSVGATTSPDPRNELKSMQTQALIIKGVCDYLSWSSALDYQESLINSKMVYLQDAGHNVYQDQPSIVMEVIRAFLTDEPLPVPIYTDIDPPSDYEGATTSND